MAIKKSELYNSLWKSCDELRGSMDASQYKDYVLVLLFMKYVSDKGDEIAEISEGGSFADMVKLKGHPDIGSKMNTIIAQFAKDNELMGIITVADFDDSEKLGKYKDKVEKLSNLIAIFENENLNFSGNRAEHDDLLGDAYEFLMRHFATESGKSKGQFYTPAEVSRIMAKVIGIENSKSQSETLYDPTCGSGSLLLKAADEAPKGISIYGQENDNATRALAVMNMWLHKNAGSEIVQGNTMADPLFHDEKTKDLKKFDYAVANPPFSYKSWSNGLVPAEDVYKRFDTFGIPPEKNGDYAFLLHFIKSLKSKGKGAIILPLGVLFRGNVEGDIRQNIVKRGYIKGIIGLPSNLFYGTGIAACIIVIDKEGADNRKGIFMIDAGKGFMKDGNKNRLRARDIHKVVDVFKKELSIPGYSRMVPLSEIKNEKNAYNLNIPRYIDSREEEDIQDLTAHLKGGIPQRDIEALAEYWEVYPSLKTALFTNIKGRDYMNLKVPKGEIKEFILNHQEFTAFSKTMANLFSRWRNQTAALLKALKKGCRPREVIFGIAEDILSKYNNKKLVDKYAVYQHLMDYWDKEMQDDLYELAAEGWKAGNVVKRRTRKVKQKGKEIEKEIPGIEGLEGLLIPPDLLISQYFKKEQEAIDALGNKMESTAAQMDELKEENTGEEGLLAEAMDGKQKITKNSLNARIKKLEPKTEENTRELELLGQYKTLMDTEADLKGQVKKALDDLEIKVIKQYPALKIEEIKTVVADNKWMAAISLALEGEMEGISHRLTGRIKELAERYETPIPALSQKVTDLTAKVEGHLRKMGLKW